VRPYGCGNGSRLRFARLGGVIVWSQQVLTTPSLVCAFAADDVVLAFSAGGERKPGPWLNALAENAVHLVFQQELKALPKCDGSAPDAAKGVAENAAVVQDAIMHAVCGVSGNC